MSSIIIFLLWRAGLFLNSFIAQKFPFTPSFPYSDIYFFPSGLPRWLWSWANFDGVHYLTIAKSGYMAQFTQAFFPLFPLVINFISKLFNDPWMIISGLVVTNVLFLTAIIMFKKLLALDYESRVVKWVILFLLFFPASFFFGSLYTESLFFLLVLLSFYFARRKQWWLSGFCGSLASFTRITGIFLLPAILWERYVANVKFKNPYLRRQENLKLNFKSIINLVKSPVVYLIPSGLIAYMVYLQWKFGDWLYFWHAQSVFGAQRSGGTIILPPQVLWRYFKILSNFNAINYQYGIAFLEVSVFILTILILMYCHMKKVRTSYLIFSWFLILIPSLTGTLSSIPRYALLVFPGYFCLGLMQNSYVKILLLLIFLGLLILLSNLYLRGLWVA